MIPVNALPIPLRDRSLPIQLLSLLTLAGTVIAVRRLMLDHFSPARSAPLDCPPPCSPPSTIRSPTGR